jgi:preprotein translocase subunit SecD
MTLIDLIVIFFFTKPLITVMARINYFNNGGRFSGFSDASLGVVGKSEAGASN